MKFPIAWHESCLLNQRAHYERTKREAEQVLARMERERVHIEIYEYQITRAKREGKDGFDADKYAKPRADKRGPQGDHE